MKQLIFLCGILGLSTVVSCSKFLDAKPQSSLEIPRKIQDLEAILNYDDRFIRAVYPASGDIASDYYFVDNSRWSSLQEFVREIYLWDVHAQTELDWNNSYRRIFDANVVLDYLHQVDSKGVGAARLDQIKGKALFFRAWSYMQLLPIFTPAYDGIQAENQMGLPLRLSADINEEITRNNLSDTYQRIKNDFIESVALLPENTSLPIHPTKAAALAALSRLCLWMGDYEGALNYTREALAYPHELLDYKLLDRRASAPFGLYNREVLFHSTMRATSAIFANSNNYVDTALLAMYVPGDLRFNLYFNHLQDGKVMFKGDYSGEVNFSIFYGLTIDELYLTHAECLVRLGHEQEAMTIVNAFLEKRWEKDQFLPFNIQGEEHVLQFILDERYKSLAYRKGIRWADLKRLNREGRFAKTLYRMINGQTYLLKPDDLRYTFLLPASVILESGMQQNPR